MTGKLTRNQFGEKVELQFELEDIMQEINFNADGIATNDLKVIDENIIEILKREKLWKKNYSLIFPIGSTQMLDVGNTEEDPSTYQYDFEIFSDPNTVIASGTCYGSLLVFNSEKKEKHSEGFKDRVESVEVVDMTLEICECETDFTKTEEEKEKVAFT